MAHPSLRLGMTELMPQRGDLVGRSNGTYLLAFLCTSLRLAPIGVDDSDTSDFIVGLFCFSRHLSKTFVRCAGIASLSSTMGGGFTQTRSQSTKFGKRSAHVEGWDPRVFVDQSKYEYLCFR